MADLGGFGPRLDVEQLLLEAQHRWLRPAEICEILRNHQKFHISPESPNRPPSGSLFLFDRKVLRYFRKDGHNWRKKKDGKTVKEAHEKLKVGSVDVLHCYYAHGEDNENFQRRSYWMLETELMHIVFVHYLEVKGHRTNIGGVKESYNVVSDSANGTTSGNLDSAASPTSTWSSSHEDADCGDSHQASSSLQVFPERQAGNCQAMDKQDAGLFKSYFNNSSSGNHEGWTSVPGLDNRTRIYGNQVRDNQRSVDLTVRGPVLGHSVAGYSNLPSHTPTTGGHPAAIGFTSLQKNAINGVREKHGSPLSNQSNWQIPLQEDPLGLLNCPTDLPLSSEMTDDLHLETLLVNQVQQPTEGNLFQAHVRSAEPEYVPKLSSGINIHIEGSINHPLPVRKSLLDAEEGLKKVDSFSRWISKELGDVENLQMQASSSGIAWSSVECETVVDGSSMSPSLSQDQRFTIIDYSPKWAYTDSEAKVLIIGTFLMNKQDIVNCNWSCMFGEVEVPAEILVDGVLCCHAPPHIDGQVPFYVTCSNRFACSEVREFKFQVGSKKITNISDIYGASTTESCLHLRLERLVAQESTGHENCIFEGVKEKRKLISKLILLKEEEESHFPVTAPTSSLSEYAVKEQVIRDLIYDKLYTWLIYKVIENGNGPNTLDEQGQGVLHLAAALGYDWAIRPVVATEVRINFRDANGWTALHWAAGFGRERTVAVLISLGADAGSLTDPSPEFPLGRTPADLASGNGHKGISGFLAESSLTSHLEKLTTNESRENSCTVTSNPVQTVSERTSTPLNVGDMQDLSLKDSLAAVCNATQAADRIHQMFRMQSFQWKQQSQCADDEINISGGRAISFVAAKTGKPAQSEGVANSAAVRIQKKYRGWTKRKEFLLIRQRIVKIQAHVRGHQVRKQYRTITWSVGILEKVILRWRRKGSGLRGFRCDALTKHAEPETLPSQEDGYDYLREGRKQSEERLQKALTRVKSMVQYPEARAQYRRLLTVVEGFREKEESSSGLSNTEKAAEGDDLIEIDSLLDDDTFMSFAFD